MKARWLALTAALCAAATSSAALDLAHLDPSVDKCTDFYDYANARWIDTATVPADRTSWGPWQELIVHNEKVLLDALDAASRAPRDGQPEWERKLVAFYRSGMDTAAIDRAGLAPLEPYLARAHAVDGAAALADALAALHAAGIGAGFGMDVEADKKDSSHYLLDIAQGGIGLPERDYYFRDDARSRALREAYVRHIAKMLQLAGADAASAERDAATILDLETALARASMTPVERRDEEKTYNRMTVEQLSERAPGFPWKRYFEALGAKRPGTLNVEQPAFMVAFAELAARRPAADWAAYLRWHILNATANALPEAFDREHFDFYGRQLLGTTQPPARPRHVIETIGGRYGSARLGQAVGRLFVQHAFSPEAKARAEEMVRNIKAALAERIRNVDWMSDATRAKALAKLQRMNMKVGYPDHWRDFADADVGDRAFVENWLRANAFDHRRDMRRIGGRVDRGEWFMGEYIVNAYYEPHLNEIVLPAAILQPPFFDARADDAVNYGGIGTVIGHEMTHGFDDRGRLYDAYGNMHDWWTPADAKRYSERAERIVAQYSAFRGIDDIPVNGKLTLGENIADQGGTEVAYDALHKALAKHNPGRIDGLTPDQRFFLSYATMWRAKYRPEIQRMLLRIDPHSPNRFRVLGTVAQMPAFAKAFSCSPGKSAQSQAGNIW